MDKRLILGSVSGFGQFILTAALTFVTIPVFIRILGPESYGIFAIVSVVGNLNVFGNLGLNAALLKFLGEQGNTQESHYDIAVALVLLCVLSLVIVLVGLTLSDIVLETVLRVPKPYLRDASSLYVMLLLSNAILLIGQVFIAIIDSHQRVYVTNSLQLLYNFSYWGLILGTLVLSHNLASIGYAIFTSSLAWFIASAIVAYSLWGRLRTKGLVRNFNRIMHKGLAYGSKIYLSGLVNFLYEPLTKILIASVLGVREVGTFDIALRIKGQIWGLFSKMLYPVWPYIVKITDKDHVRRTICELQLIVIYLAIPATVVVLFTASSFIEMWMGKGNAELSTAVALITSGALLLSATMYPTYVFMGAKGYPQVLVYAQVANVAGNGLFIAFSVRHLGILAAVIGNIFGLAASFAVLLYCQRLYLKSTIFKRGRTMERVLLMSILLPGVGLLMRLLPMSNLFQISLIPTVVVVCTVIFFKWLGVSVRPEFMQMISPL